MAGIQSGRKISLNTVWQAALFPFENTMALVRLSLPPALISAAILYAASRTAPLIGSPLPFQVSKIFVYTVLGALVAVGIHRLILRGEEPEWALPKLRSYELAYGAAALIFAAVLFAEQGVIQYLFDNPAVRGLTKPLDPVVRWIWHDLYIRLLMLFLPPGLVVVLVLLAAATIWPAVRLALVFPHAAVTGQMSLGESWAATKGNFWRLIGASVLIAIFLYLLSMVFGLTITMTLKALQGLPAIFTISLLALTWRLLQFSMLVALISYIYKELIQDAEPVAPLQSDFPPPLRPELGT